MTTIRHSIQVSRMNHPRWTIVVLFVRHVYVVESRRGGLQVEVRSSLLNGCSMRLGRDGLAQSFSKDATAKVDKGHETDLKVRDLVIRCCLVFLSHHPIFDLQSDDYRHAVLLVRLALLPRSFLVQRQLHQPRCSLHKSDLDSRPRPAGRDQACCLDGLYDQTFEIEHGYGVKVGR